jgi:DedD protein
MREGAKQRLIGAVVIVALAVIFVPMLFEDPSVGDLPPIPESIPPAPDLAPDGRSEVFLGPGDSGLGGLDSGDFTASQPLELPPAGDLEPADPRQPAAPESGSEPGEAEDLPPVALAPAAPTAVPTAPEPAKPAGTGGMPSWVIQVASLGTPESAGELESRLREGGFSAFVEKAEVNGKLYYRVRVGPEADRASVERTASQLRDRHRLDTLIQSYP